MAEPIFSAAASERFRALLEVAEAIASHRDLPGLFHELAERLPRVVGFDFLVLLLHEPAHNAMRLHILESRVPTAGIAQGSELPVEESMGGVVWRTQQPLVIADASEETRFPRVMEMVREYGVKSLCTLPLTTAQRRLGAMSVGSLSTGVYTPSDVNFLELVARQVAVAVDNALSHQDARSYQQQLGRERDRLRLLLEINNALVANLDLRQLFNAISSSLRRVIHHDYTSLTLIEGENQLRLHALDFPQGKGIVQEEMTGALEGSAPAQALESRRPLVLNQFARSPLAQQSEMARRHIEEGLRSACIVPLVNRDRVLGTLNAGSLKEDAFTEDDVELLTQVANQVAIAVDNALAFNQIAALQAQLAEEKLYLEDEIRTEHDFEEIVGESEALKRVLKKVETVAPTDSTVLVQGETGTGKEVIARAIHNLSRRRDATFVKVNCAAIPSGLLESELFGHERGAFTGAITQKIGRFELAHRGTLFLDEIGDIPLELQPKLLRVLQEREFERLGSTRTTRVDVRLVAATNRNLVQMVEDREFRSDLYYRVNVFPIVVPPLRERPEDIPALVRYFAQKYARRMNKSIETIPTEAMQALQQAQWPGNVRELENLIERAVILSQGPVLRVPLAELKQAAETPAVAGGVQTLDTAEREHILRALRETRGVVGGPRGAAALLGMKRTTLQSRMRKLGIANLPSADAAPMGS
ncbi:MAG TPA: sigma 54-interacting transcriptional regulator [Terriglobia bacterium]|nr:sigma 54-interacting transcriptional regulator [Terriglobia bacterium]